MTLQARLEAFATRAAQEDKAIRQSIPAPATETGPGYLRGVLVADGATIPAGLPLPTIIVRMPA